ncbi:phage infection protein, partial [Bacillus paranthracis]|nr:phage infection protein [Bacillus paranthracis]
DLNAVSNQLQARTEGISYLINVFTELQNSATTDFGKSFFQGRVDRLTKLKSGMENANNGIKDIVNVIGTGQEVKKDVTDVANQKLDAANALIDQAEKDYNETFVADYKKAVSTVDQAKANANEIYDNAKADYDKAKNGLES